MAVFKPIVILALVCLPLRGLQGQTLKAKKIDDSLERAKKVVQAAESLRAFEQAKSKVKVTTFHNTDKIVYLMDVLQSTDRRAYMEFTSPAAEVGRRMLAIETSYWSKFPDSKRVVAISRREAIGNSAFAIADVFQMDTEADYLPTILGEESVEKVPCLKVELKAKHTQTPYHKVIYYVGKRDSYPVKALFYGTSGKHLKTMTIEKSGMLDGKRRPKILKMSDAITKGRVSYWHTKAVTNVPVPDQVFTKAHLKGR